MAVIIVGIIEALGDLICKFEPNAADDFAEIIAVANAFFGIEG